MNALLRIAAVGRGSAGWMSAGLLVTLLSVGALLALSVGSAGLALPTGQNGAASLLVVLVLPAVVRGLGVGRVLLRYAERLVTHAATFRFLASLRVWLFRGLAERSAGGLGMVRSGDVLSRLVGDVEALDGLYMRIALPGIAAVLLAPVLVLTVLGSGAVAAGLVGALFITAAIVLPALAAQSTRRHGTRLAEASAEFRTAALDAVQGLREVLAYGAQDRTMAMLGAREDALVAAQRVIARRAALAQAGALLCSQAALLVVLQTGSAGLVPSLFLCLAAFEVVSGMPRAGVLAGYAAGAAHRIVAAADRTPATVEPSQPRPLPSGTGLRFEAVQFSWQPERRPVLDGLTLDIPAGSRVAVLGPSGAGKSTLVSLALKVVSPQAGRVLLGGTDMAKLSATDVRSRMAWLGQDTHVFRDTVRANLLLGRPGASDDMLWEALEQAQVAHRIRALPGGLDAILGVAGLSGGESRRVALARTLVSDAPILLLDEPAAGLDATTEIAFFQTLNTVAPGRTVVMIVHRLTGVEQLDRIWRLTAGRAVVAAA